MQTRPVNCKSVIWVLGVHVCWRAQVRVTLADRSCTSAPAPAPAPAPKRKFSEVRMFYFLSIERFSALSPQSAWVFWKRDLNRQNLGRGGYEPFVTFENWPLMHSHRDPTPKYSPVVTEICYFFCCHPFYRPTEFSILSFFRREHI